MQNLKIRFQVSIATAIVVIIAALTATTLGSVYVASSEAAAETAGTLFSGVARSVHERVDRLLGGAVRLAELGASQPDIRGVAGAGREFPAQRFMFSALSGDASLYSLYYGFANGDFLQVIATRGDERILAAHKAPAQTAWVVRTISGQGENRSQAWTFLDGDRNVLGQMRDSKPAYDPRQRPWYEAAAAHDGVQISSAYVFNSLKEPGITASQRWPGGGAVFGVDITLAGLEQFVSEQAVASQGGVILIDDAQRVLAMSARLREPGQPLLADLAALGSDRVRAVAEQLDRRQENALQRVSLADRQLLVHLSKWQESGRGIGIAIVAPMEDFIGHVRRMQQQILLLALAALVVFLPVAVVFSVRIAGTVRSLAVDAVRVRKLDFSGNSPADSRIVEFHELGAAFGLMKETLASKTRALEVAQEKLARLVELGIAMSGERDSDKLMEMVLLGAKELTNADGGTLYTVGEDGALHFQILRNDTLGVALGGTSGKPANIPPVRLYGEDGQANHQNVVSHAVHEHKTITVDDAYDSTCFDFSGTREFDKRNGYRSKSFMTVPLQPRGGDIIGALQLINARRPGSDEVVPFSPEIQRFVEALAAQAAVAIDNHNLVTAQGRLLDSFIELIATAIDAKSPYTGGHCNRVPELARLLAEAACAQASGPFADFAFTSEDEWREFRIGAWLHDCGKVTTPEYVVDKATKLETIYNRIHEVRTRFEVLWRDAEIAYWRQRADSTRPVEELDRERAEEQARLREEFAFVAECNIGGEFMSDKRVERLKAIASRTWVRQFDDTLGLSHEELRRRDPASVRPAPAEERLLADRLEHVVPRPNTNPFGENPNGFKMDVPPDLYNFGELYNLCIPRGTLTAEERFKINDHIVQTIAMLGRLPFPKTLARVPDYAGAHHETMIGTGYPRKLTRDQMSVPARIMAIADVFEALTACDRPYKKAKTLSEALKIMTFMVKDQHIDPDLFDLFLESGVFKTYADHFLLPEQIDAVDADAFRRAV